ncbi:hypothetical protein HPB50_011934 [Hyalomma asiaticum]|uniref:Uncharacterized protein n=1 Tax=Hyalomma asiaticum TaxID=266040 RepID=A0ACB7SV20_HYAAI|nr:hypothetical protein HPB50_011934 [Hyalomma asiaticum]
MDEWLRHGKNSHVPIVAARRPHSRPVGQSKSTTSTEFHKCPSKQYQAGHVLCVARAATGSRHAEQEHNSSSVLGVSLVAIPASGNKGKQYRNTNSIAVRTTNQPAWRSAQFIDEKLGGVQRTNGPTKTSESARRVAGSAIGRNGRWTKQDSHFLGFRGY